MLATPPRLIRLVRSLLAGSLATLADVGSLALLVHVLSVGVRAAGAIALALGAVVTFALQRSFAFRATRGSARAQLARFVVVELGALALNAALYDLVVRRVPGAAAACVLVRLVTSHLVFVLYSYPAWHWVFGEREAREA